MRGNILCSVMLQGLEPIPTDTGQETGYTLDKSSSLGSSINLDSMSLDYGRKPEYPKGTQDIQTTLRKVLHPVSNQGCSNSDKS